MSNNPGFSLPHAHEPPQASFAKRVLAALGDGFRRFKAVNELERLSDRQLRDIGVERREIEAVAEREIARLRAR